MKLSILLLGALSWTSANAQSWLHEDNGVYYLNLNSQNIARFGTNTETTYTKVRIVGTPTPNLTQIEIDAADNTYSTTTNPATINTAGHNIDWAVWGSAWDCVSGRGRDFTADLTGTPFRFDTSVMVNNKGYNAFGSISCTPDGKICSGVKCGGYCGFCTIYQDIGYSLNKFINDGQRTARTFNKVLATLFVDDQQAFAAGFGASPVTAAPSAAPILTCSDISKLPGLTPQQVYDECSKTTYCKAKFKARKNKAKCKKKKCKKCKQDMACCNDNPEGCIYNPAGGKNTCTDA